MQQVNQPGLVYDELVEYLTTGFERGRSAVRAFANQISATPVVVAPRYRIKIMLVLAAFDLVGVVAAVHLSLPKAPGTLGLTTAAMVLLTARICGLYAVECSTDLWRSAKGTTALAAVLLVGVVGVVSIAAGWAAASHMAAIVTFAAGVAMFGRVFCGLVIWLLAKQLVERVVIVGTCRSGDPLLRSRALLSEQVKIVGQIVVGDGDPAVPLIGRIGATVETGADGIATFGYPGYDIDRVIILKSDLDDQQLIDVVRSLKALSIPIHVVADMPGANHYVTLPCDFAWVVRDGPLKPGAMFAKRCLDLLASVFLLVVVAPLLLLIPLLICLETPGPALFRQVRLGRDNRPFTIFKFRTMRVDAPAADGSIQAVPGDARITRIGAILRKTSIDELPQLFNVLNGTMSLVGPRPHPTELNRRFAHVIEDYSARHRITPGITGWAQVNGLRGETSTVEHMKRRLQLDLEYIRSHSIAFDLWILLRTVIVVIGHRNAY